jgi:phosphopantetheinyl transferase
MTILEYKQPFSYQSIAVAEVDYNQEKELFDELTSKNINLSGLTAIKNHKRRIEWMSIRSLLLKMDPMFSDIYYNKHRKPFLKNQNRHLSISHSHHRIAVYLNEKQICGVDLQHCTSKILRIKEKFLKQAELDTFNSGNIEELTLLWSIKEALFKVYGKKDIYLKDDITVQSLDFKGKSGSATAVFDSKENNLSYKLNVEIIDDYALAYVVNY